MQFGNWIVRDEGISWNGGGLHRFDISLSDLPRKGRIGKEGTQLYEWILLAMAEDWLTQNDLYDLNFAFVFAAGKYGLDFSYETFDATLAEQYDLLDLEDAEDPEA